MRAENDVTPRPPLETGNSLHAGGMLNVSRGHAHAYFPGPTDGRWFPADPQMAVGPNHVFQWVNLSFAIFRKTDGALLYGPANGKTLWQGFGGPCEQRNDGDPIVMYYQIDGRCLMSQYSLTS